MLNFLRANILLEEKKSKYNGTVEVWRSWGLGKYLQVGGLTQSGGVLNAIWRTTLRKVKSQKSKVKNCLILGLGGGSVIRSIQKYWPGAKITGVDIDPVMVELGRKYLDLKDINVKIKDAYKFVQKNKQRYDLIIVDTYLGDSYPSKFESSDFIIRLRILLVHGGVVIFNRLYYDEKRTQAVKFGEKLKKYFSKVEYFYPEANLMFLCTNC